ncbi:MAG: hypothetical protein RL385_2172 [Pseudomonadota bacterium]
MSECVSPWAFSALSATHDGLVQQKRMIFPQPYRPRAGLRPSVTFAGNLPLDATGAKHRGASGADAHASRDAPSATSSVRPCARDSYHAFAQGALIRDSGRVSRGGMSD